MLPLTLCLLLLAGLVYSTTGSAIVFTSSETSIKPFFTSNLTLTCSLNDTAPAKPALGSSHDVIGPEVRNGDVTTLQNIRDKVDDNTNPCDAVNETAEDVQFVYSIVIYRDGVALATIPEDLPVQLPLEEVNYRMSGHLTSQAGERGRLQLTWPHPTHDDAGTYRCEVNSVSGQGHPVIFSQYTKVLKETITTDDLVSKVFTMEMEKKIMQKEINEMKAENASLNKTLEAVKKSEKILNDATHLEINKLKYQDSAQNRTLETLKTTEKQINNEMQLRVNSLEANISALNKSLESLRVVSRVEPDIFFSAILSATKSYSTNDIVVYDKVVTNEGAAYNNNTGKFTAPVSGFYNFQLHAWSMSHKKHFLALRHNEKAVISVAKLGNEQTGTSNSLMLRLSQGDLIDVLCTSGSTELYYDTQHRISNTLSGRLISVI